MHSEKELFLRISEGEEAAFEALFRLYVPQVRLAILSVLQSEVYVKDILQEIFLDIWLNRDKLPAIEQPRNWIFKITYNRCYTWLQRLVKEEARRQLAAGGMPAEGNEPEEQLDFRETASLVRQAIGLLSPRAREIYVLHRNTGLKVAEIASQLQVAPQTVRNSLHRSGQEIRQFLLDKGVVIPLAIVFSLFF